MYNTRINTFTEYNIILLNLLRLNEYTIFYTQTPKQHFRPPRPINPHIQYVVIWHHYNQPQITFIHSQWPPRT